MVFHLVRSIPAVAAIAATMMILSDASRHTLLCSIAEDNALNLLQSKSIAVPKLPKSSDITNTTPASKVVYIKTHFTGSETLTGILLRYCDIYNRKCPCEAPGLVTINMLQRFVKRHRGETLDIWPWHVQYSPEPFHELMPGALTVSLFREPKSRIRSGFSHEAFDAAMIRHKLSHLKSNSFVGCDGQMHYHVEKLSYLDMVLITEDYDRGLVLLAKKLGWPLQTLLYASLHKSTDEHLSQDHLQAIDEFFAYVEQPSERLTESARAWKHDCFEVDGQLYKAANKTYHEQLQNLTYEERHEVETGVALLQSANEALADCCSKHPFDLFCSAMLETSQCWNQPTDHGRPPLEQGNISACHVSALQKLLVHSVDIEKTHPL